MTDVTIAGILGQDLVAALIILVCLVLAVIVIRAWS